MVQKRRALEIEILYEDEHVLVINKPAGLLVHDNGRTEVPTVSDWFSSRNPEAVGVGEEASSPEGIPLERSGIVHRLDRETSGVMILAKTQPAFLHLKSQFHDRLANKEYRAFVYGTMKEKWGSISRPIGRSTKDFRLRSAQRGARGTLRAAVTDWELLVQNNTYAYLKLRPKTGRTHQIRVHLKAIGRPVVGDMLYAPEVLLKTESLGFDRLALHAHRLSLMLPDGMPGEFSAPLPKEFSAAEKALAGDIEAW